MKKIYNGIAIVLAIVFVFYVGMAVGGKSSQSLDLGAANRLPHGYWDTADGYYVDGSAVIDGSGELEGVINSEVAASVGAFTQGGGTTATTTVSTATLLASYFDTENVIAITPNVASTVTFPGYTLLTSFIPTIGDTRRIYIYNASTTSPLITLAGGAGMTLSGVATSTFLVGANKMAAIDFVRASSTAIYGLVSTGW